MAILPAHHAPRAADYLAKGYWISGPAPDPLALAAQRSPEKTALIDRDGALNYAALDRLVDQFALALLTRGLGPGDRIAIQLPNVRAFAIAQQAALRIGAAYVPLLPQLRDADVEYALTASKARALVVPGIFKGFDHAAMAQRMPVEHVFVVGDSFEMALAEDNSAQAARLAALAVDPDALRVVLFTSGTESKPKGVLHSYNTQYFGLKRHVTYFGLGPDDVVMCVSPVGHGTGAVNGIEFAIHLGATVVLMESWNAASGLDVMRQHGATMMWGATTFYADLVRAAEGAPPLEHFRYAFTAGAPVPQQLPALVSERLGATLIAAYGQSEGQNITITRADDPIEKLLGSDGRFHDGIDWKLVDANRQPLPRDAEGEIAYRGPNVCLGYLDPAHTARAFDEDGYIYSGDLGRVDANGYLRITGRAKDIIIRGGENISPAEVEGLLFDHPMIDKISVIGFPDERLGERACAVILPAGSEKPEVADLVRHMAGKNVAKFKYPEAVLLVDEMPMTASGKIRKEVLRPLVLEACGS
ncbi:AMP-binding protein [Novosphingobium malaysiense]|uniref:AMP-dependent synthetase n=1 Tax=Novosphingobium malaysiense TaxID=1348853 RepID=A0A0B1ZIL7_9SPHN|nr:AMP-binding protein [Novosphingobium malaysiense]KHK89167.1 hypothetical protein LK12_21840 [Novosphingobium malaysiense]